MRLGIIGTGKIAAMALPAVEDVPEIEVTALFARPHSLLKGKDLAARHGIPAVYTDYDDLLKEADVDTVYIGLVNSVHYQYAARALESGKHVILEKPFTGTAEEAEDLFRTARQKRLFLFEAITVLHNGIFEKMKETLPLLGSIRLFQANYSQYSSRYDRYLEGTVDPAFDPGCLGGALRDINVYNIHFAAGLFGSPDRVCYYPNTGYNGVDTSGILIMEYEGFKAVCCGAKDSDSPCGVIVQGEKGYMKTDGKPNGATNLTTVIKGSGESLYLDEPRHRMTGEFRDFARMIADRDYDQAAVYEQETLRVMRILDQCRA